MDVLVEGASDRRAVEVVAARLGLVLPAVTVLHGITNLRAHLSSTSAPAVLLHDLGESAYVDRVLADHPLPVRRFVCDTDLEDELVRAVGVAGVLAVVDAQGERAAYDRMAQQPAQRDRTGAQRLVRWLGARSGHKLTYAGLLAAAVPLERVPAPLRDLVVAAAGDPPLTR